MARPLREKEDMHIPTNYHICSRTIWQEFLIKAEDKQYFMQQLAWLSHTYFVENIAFNIMDNHFHLIIKIYVPVTVSHDDIEERFENYYQGNKKYNPQQKQKLIAKYGDLSAFVQDFKQRFSRYINKKNNKKGHFWADRFKSNILRSEEQLQTCIAYVDLNAVRAGIVKQAYEYPYCTPGHIVKTNNNSRIISKNTQQIYKYYTSTKPYSQALNQFPKAIPSYYINYIIYLTEIAKQESKQQLR